MTAGSVVLDDPQAAASSATQKRRAAADRTVMRLATVGVVAAFLGRGLMKLAR